MSVPSPAVKAVLSECAPDVGIAGPVCLSVWHLISMGTGLGVQVLSLLPVQGLVTGLQFWNGREALSSFRPCHCWSLLIASKTEPDPAWLTEIKTDTHILFPQEAPGCFPFKQ